MGQARAQLAQFLVKNVENPYSGLFLQICGIILLQNFRFCLIFYQISSHLNSPEHQKLRIFWRFLLVNFQFCGDLATSKTLDRLQMFRCRSLTHAWPGLGAPESALSSTLIISAAAENVFEVQIAFNKHTRTDAKV